MNPVGYLFIIFGALMLPRTTIEWSIRTSNAMRGIKTEITKGTLLTYRISGIIIILFGLLLP